MNSKTYSKRKLALCLQHLPAEQVKQAVIKWLNEDEGEAVVSAKLESNLIVKIDTFQQWVASRRGQKTTF